jgi:hypothetical protein
MIIFIKIFLFNSSGDEIKNNEMRYSRSGMGAWTGSIWLRIGTGGGLL